MIYNKSANKKTFLYQFIPENYKYLLKTDKIQYRGMNLKTAYLVNIIHEIMLKYYFHKDDLIERELKFNIWSIILRKKYGAYYNYYIDYLIDHKFIIMVSDYFKAQKSRTYKLNIKSLQDVERCRITDRVLLKKNSKEYLMETFLHYNNSPIPLEIRKKLVEYLYEITIDGDGSMALLNELKKNHKIYDAKYQRNIISVDNLNVGNIFFKFDEYGRMHTNFTVLKKEIRKNFITFKGVPTYELDIKNSQPLFLVVLMKEKMSVSELIRPDVSKYIDLVRNGLIYEELVEKGIVRDRESAKMMMYKVLFGKNGYKKRENVLFQQHFPNVFEFIKNYKEQAKDYKVLSHDLQLSESDFIYNKVVRHLMNSFPEMPIFTIHDSIVVPIKYKDEVTPIFDYYLRNLTTL